MKKDYMLDWVTVSFGASGGDVIQPESQWFDAEGCVDGVGTAQFPCVDDNVTVSFETSKTREGPWAWFSRIEGGQTPSQVPTAADEYCVHGSITNRADASTQVRFDRFIRWRVTATGEGVACFRSTMLFRG